MTGTADRKTEARIRLKSQYNLITENQRGDLKETGKGQDIIQYCAIYKNVRFYSKSLRKIKHCK